MRWFEQHRMDWISQRLRVAGYINRKHLIKKFGISVPQASVDLRAYKRRNPGAMTYDVTAKRYIKRPVNS